MTTRPVAPPVRREGGHRSPTRAAGFTIIELIFCLLIVSAVASMAIPAFMGWVAGSRVENAARVVAGDFREAVALAARQGTPVRIAFDAVEKEYRFTQRGTGDVVHLRAFGAGTEFPITSVTASGAPVEVYPNRSVSGPISITLAAGEYSSRVEMTSAGFIRIVRL